ncbi:PREDICTED: synaptonemal complex central element protein 3-like [Nanorana parkeri]|uniref:synaptonemal complex central element protein 3-like n=1 Tax=Nanorana parkeri TaxID=125878 RepID=UPI0008543C20|nr:PREDICTED: synaptonemal complex central element protein 3-like [Nanorana parkeri]
MDAPESDKYSHEDVLKMLQDLNKDLEQMLEQMEKLSVDAAWMAHDMVTARSNPALAEQAKRLNEAFQKCLNEVEKNWKEVLEESMPAS